jgi:hypothetical protein
MKNEKLQMTFAEGFTKGELIIKEVTSLNELDIKAPLKLNIDGVIGSVTEFLSKRNDQADQINQKRCHILVNRENISIKLIFNENDEYLTGSIKGVLEEHPSFKKFGINSSKVWTPTELGLFFKMNRAFFPSKEENMKLVTELMNFTAKVNNSIDRSVKENGDRTDNFSQVVNSNLPASFTLTIPIFKGTQAETLEIETFAQVSGRDVSFVLLSPSANQTIEDIRDKVIDEQLSNIREICPDIAIIEQ